MDRVIIFVDVVKSTATKIKLGDAVANQMIGKRLADIELDFRTADPTVQRQAPSAGDEILLLGTDPVALFLAALVSQGKFKALPIGPATYISIGMGEFETAPDGQHVSLRGAPIDLTHRILEFCPEAGVVTTEAIRPKIQAAGYASKLIRLEHQIEGFGLETYYEADEEFVRSIGSRLPAIPIGGTTPTPVIDIRLPFVPPAPDLNTLPRDGRTPSPPNHFWRRFAIAGLSLIAALAMAALAMRWSP